MHRFKSIDSLRGLAAIIVVLHHYCFIYGRDFNQPQLLPELFVHGYYGVELFFIISGFVIYYSVLNAKSVKEFLVKRVIRLYPIYWVCLIITFITVQLFPLSVTRDTSLKEALLGLTMFNGLLKTLKPVDPSYWSLLIEWFFYLMIALLFAITKDDKRIKIYLWCWIGLILFYTLAYKIPVMGAFFNLRYGPLFIAGISCYYLFVLHQQTVANWLLLSASYITALIALQDLTLFIPMITIVFLLVLLVLHFNFACMQHGVLLFLGKISYALYLIHQNMGFVIMEQGRKIGLPFMVNLTAALAFSITVATLLTNYVERPLSRKLKFLLAIK